MRPSAHARLKPAWRVSWALVGVVFVLTGVTLLSLHAPLPILRIRCLDR